MLPSCYLTYLKINTNGLGLEELAVYQKNRSAVFLRCEVANTTRRNLASFLGSYTNTSTNQTYTYREEATPCILWPESFCFNISGLEPDKLYKFNVSGKRPARSTVLLRCFVFTVLHVSCVLTIFR